jgi:hypothetical protein
MPARSSTVVSLFEIHSRTEPEPRQPTPGRERSRSISGERGATAAGGLGVASVRRALCVGTDQRGRVSTKSYRALEPWRLS